MSRFDYVKYDERANDLQQYAKGLCAMLEEQILGLQVRLQVIGPLPNAQHALRSLEETYMWIGKAIRDDQILRNGGAELQEERKDG